MWRQNQSVEATALLINPDSHTAVASIQDMLEVEPQPPHRIVPCVPTIALLQLLR